MNFQEWLEKARAAGVHYWAYAELVDDDREGAERAWKAGEDPDAYIKELGQELDLHEFGKHWGGW